MSGALRRQAGLTLVELLVATTLSLVLLSGVLLVFQANKTTYRMQTGLSTLQESGRYAMRQITEDLKLAGYGGCISPHLEANTRMIAVPPAAGTPADFINDMIDGVFFEGTNDIAAAVQIGGNNITVKQGTDTLTMFGPLEKPVARVDGEQGASGNLRLKGVGFGFANGGYFAVSDCYGTEIYQSSGVTEDTSDSSNPVTLVAHGGTGNQNGGVFSRAYGGDSVVAEFTTHQYFVGQTGRLNQAGDLVHALYRFNGSGNAEELVEGVENLQVEYGEDTDGDGVVNAFRHAGAVTDWSEVLAVRVWLLVNSVDQSSAVTATYTSTAPSTTANPTADNRMHQEFSALVSVRNSIF